MKIRAANADDVPAILEIRLSVRENMVTKERLEELGVSEESLAEMIESSHFVFCAEEEDRVVGFSMADKDKATIFALFVDPDHEGKGVGAKLLDTSVGELWSAGHARATLTTEPDTRAFEFYKRQGWKLIGPAPNGEVRLELLKPD
ncbi:MAG: GNAT family N-acetyltransferase [Pyrinomonadaceae bacterium]|nr:GNAT family N-acetyltransferase [Pyrinomonadaceae bacterium]